MKNKPCFCSIAARARICWSLKEIIFLSQRFPVSILDFISPGLSPFCAPLAPSQRITSRARLPRTTPVLPSARPIRLGRAVATKRPHPLDSADSHWNDPQVSDPNAPKRFLLSLLRHSFVNRPVAHSFKARTVHSLRQIQLLVILFPHPH